MNARPTQNFQFRSRWLNFILHLTANIAERKQTFVRSHVVRTFFECLSVVVLEGVLAIVSIPLYFIGMKEKVSASNEFSIQYNLRKFITLFLMWGVTVLFVLKAGLIFYSGMTVYNGSFFPSKPANAENTGNLGGSLLMKIITQPVDSTLAVPKITVVEMGPNTPFVISGTSSPRAHVAVLVSPEENINGRKPSALYLSAADANGTWDITQDRPNFALHPGAYVASAFVFDENNNHISEYGQAFHFQIQPTLLESWITLINTVLNSFLFCFIGIGFILILITI